jgi:competence protein ComEC
VAAASLWTSDEKRTRIISMEGVGSLIHLSAKRALDGFEGCKEQDILVLSYETDEVWPCQTYGPKRLATLGAVAIHLDGNERKIIGAKEASGQRLWHKAPPKQGTTRD